MADEVFQIGFETTGDAEAAAAFEKLKLEQRSMQAQSKALAAQLKTLEAAGQQNTTEFKELSKAYIQAKEAASQMGRQANSVSANLRNQASAAQQSATAMVDSRKASQNAGRQMGMLVNSVSELGYSFGTAIPGMQTYGTQLAMMGGNAVTFGAAMGPAGVAVGVLSGLLPVAIGALNSFSDSTDDATDSQHSFERATKNATNALEGQIEAMRRAARERNLDSGGMVASGQAGESVEELEERLRRQRAQLQQITRSGGEFDRAMSALSEAGERHGRELSERTFEAQREASERLVSVRESRAALERRIAETEAMRDQRMQQQLAAMVGERVAEEDEEEERQEDRRSARRHRQTAAEREAERKRVQAVQDAAQAAIDVVANEYARREELARAHTRMLLAEERRRADQEAEIQRGLTREIQAEIRLDEAEARRAMRVAEQHAREMTKRQEELGSITSSMWSDIGGSVTSAAGDMFKFVVEGAEGGGDAFLAMLDSFLEATAVQYSIKALAHAMEAVGAAARYDYAAAAQHGIAAGMAVAVAAATGLASAAIPNAPTSSASAASNAPAQPAPSAQGAPSAPLTINLFSPNAVATKAEQAQQLAAIERVGRRELGRF